MNGRPLDLGGVVAALRRRRWIAVVGGLLGVLLGAGFAVSHPPKPVATAVVLLPPAPTDATGEPLRDMATEVNIATGQSILTQAGRELKLGLSYEQLHRLVSASAPTTQLISISAKETDAETASQLALAVANDYITYTNDTQTTSSGDLVASLHSLITTYTNTVQKLQSEIDTVQSRLRHEPRRSVDAGSDQETLTQLQSEQTAASLQRTNAQTQLTLAEQSNSGTAARLLQSPSVHRSSKPLHIATFSLGGLLAGLALAAALILAGRRSAARLWLSTEIADAVGAPTLTWLPPRPVRTAGGAKRLLNGASLSEADVWRIRRAQQHLGLGDAAGDTPVRLLVLAFGEDTAAVGAAACFLFALQRYAGLPASAEGVDTRATRSLRQALSTRSGKSPVANADSGSVLLAVDRESPMVTGLADPAVTLLAVSSGAATSDDLGRVAMSVLDIGGRITGVIVVNPLQDDLAISENRSKLKVHR